MSEETTKLLSNKSHEEKSYSSFESGTHSADERAFLLRSNGSDQSDAKGSFTDSLGLKEGEGKEDEGKDDDGNEEGQKAKAPISLVQKLTFLGVAITYITSAMSLSVIGPFFPNEAEKRDVNPTESGLVFGIFALVSFLASPIWGKYLPVIGGRFMFLAGSFVTSGCNLLFGFLDQIEDKTLFLVYCLAIRTVEAIGSASVFTAAMAICANVFPDNVAQMTSLLESLLGLGFAIGAPIGSLFYATGGYELPFIVLGSMGFVVMVANIFIIPNVASSDEESEAGSLLPVLKIPAVCVALICNTWSYASLGLIDSNISLFLQSPPLLVKDYLVGVIFLLFGGGYALFSPICGYIADRKKSTRIMMAMGTALSTVSLMLIGPSPFLHFQSQIWIVIVVLLLCGVGLALGTVVSFLDMLMSAQWYGLPDDLATQSIVSGLYVMSYSLGAFIGPIGGGALVTQFGFEWTTTILAGGGFLILLLMFLFNLWEFQCGKGRRIPTHMKETGSRLSVSYESSLC